MREWFADYLEASNRHDLDAVRELVDPGVRRAHLTGGADAWIADLEDLFQAFPDWQWRLIQVPVEEDRLAVHLRASGTQPTRAHSAALPRPDDTRTLPSSRSFAWYRSAGSTDCLRSNRLTATWRLASAAENWSSFPDSPVRHTRPSDAGLLSPASGGDD